MSLLPLMKLRLATPSVLVDVGRVRDLSYVRDAVRPPRDRRAHASPRSRDERRARPGLRRPARGRGAGRRQPGPAPGHDRRFRRARRSRRPTSPPRSSRSTPRSSCRVRAASVTSRHPTSSSASSRPRSRPTSCSPRSACRKTGPGGFGFEKFNRRAQDYAIVGAVAARGERRNARRAREHGIDPAAGVGRRERAGTRRGPGRGRRARPRSARSRPADLNASPEFRAHLAQVLVAAPRLFERDLTPRTARSRDRGRRCSRRAAGVRFGGDVPKPLVTLGSQPLVTHALAAARASGLEPVLCVVSDDRVAVGRPGGSAGRAQRRRRADGIASSLHVVLRALDARARRSTRWSSGSPTSRSSEPRPTGGSRAADDLLAVATYAGRQRQSGEDRTGAVARGARRSPATRARGCSCAATARPR